MKTGKEDDDSPVIRRRKNFGTSPSPRRTRGAIALPPCRSRTRGGTHRRPLLIRTSPSSGCWKRSRRQRAHSAHARHRNRQDIHRLSDRVETLPQPLESEPRTNSPAAHSVSRRPQHPRQSGLQRFLRFPEDALVRIAPDDIRKKGKVPKNGSIFFTIFQTFMSGPAEGWEARPLFRRVSARLLRLHRHRRVSSRRRERREQLARHHGLLRARRAARADRDAEAEGQRRYLQVFRRAGLHLFAEGGNQRRLPHALQGEADFDDAR